MITERRISSLVHSRGPAQPAQPAMNVELLFSYILWLSVCHALIILVCALLRSLWYRVNRYPGHIVVRVMSYDPVLNTPNNGSKPNMGLFELKEAPEQICQLTPE